MECNFPVSILIEKLKSDFFGEDWLSIPDHKDVTDYKDLWLNNIVEASTEIFKYYTLLLLSGEYCRLTDSSSEDLWTKALEAYLKTISSQIEIGQNEEIQLELQNWFWQNILFPLNRIIKRDIDYIARDLRVQFGLENKRQL